MPQAADQTLIELGWMAEPLHQQLGVPRKDLEDLQKDHDAIVRLRARGYLNDGALRRTYRELRKNIPGAIRQAEELRQAARAARGKTRAR